MTTINDTFDRANSATLGTSSDGDWSWTEVVANISIVSNQASSAGNGSNARAEKDLATANHYSQINATTIVLNTGGCGVMVRYDSASNSGYYYLVKNDVTATHRLFKIINAVLTQIGSTVNETLAALPGVVKLTVDGTNTLTGSFKGTTKITGSAADATLNSFTRTGLRWAQASNGDTVGDDFQAADIATAGFVRFSQRLDGLSTLGQNRA